MILSIGKSGLKRLDEFYKLAKEWHDKCINFSEDLELENALLENSRYAAYDDMIRSGIPEDDWEKLQWLTHFDFIITSERNYLKMTSESSSMPSGMLPNHHSEKWPSGIKPLSAIKGTKNKVLAKEIKEIGKKITHLLSEKDFVKLRRMGYCAWLFNPTLGFLNHPNGTLRGYELTSFPLSINPPENPLIASIPLQISLL